MFVSIYITCIHTIDGELRSPHYIYIYIYIYICFFIWWSPFIPSRNLDEVFTYNHLAIMYFRSRSHVKASMVLTIADHLCI